MNNVLSRISAIFKWISGVFVGITVILNFVAVITRYFFKSPIMWCEEVSLLLFVSSISFALIPMSYSRRAVKLDFFTDLMGRNGRNRRRRERLCSMVHHIRPTHLLLPIPQRRHRAIPKLHHVKHPVPHRQQDKSFPHRKLPLDALAHRFEHGLLYH